MDKNKETLLNQPFGQLGFSRKFCLVTEQLGLITPADLVHQQHLELTRLPGFDQHLLEEFIQFMEDRGLGEYLI